MKYVFLTLAAASLLGLAKLSGATTGCTHSPTVHALDVSDGSPADLDGKLTFSGLDGLTDGLDGKLADLDGELTLSDLDGELTPTVAAPGPFGWFKKGIKKIVKAFAPGVLIEAGSFLDSKLNETAEKLTKNPNIPVAMHFEQAWSSGTGCSGFRNGSCAKCYAVAADAVGGTSLDQMLAAHQNLPRCGR